MQILIAISHKKLRDTLTFALESQHGAKVTSASTAGEAIEPLIRSSSFHLLIVDYPAISDPILKFLSAMKMAVPIAIVLPEEGTPPAAYAATPGVRIIGYLQGNALLEDLSAMVLDLKKQIVVDPVVEDIAEDEFCRVPSDLLKDQNPLSADVYVRLSPGKYLKVLHANERFGAADRDKYFIEKAIDFLYVRKTDSPALVRKFTDSLKAALLQAESNPEAAAKVSAEIQTATLDLIARLGVTPEVRSIIKSNILLTVKSLGANPKLRGVLSKITANREMYISSHSTALAQLCCAMAAAMDWGSASTFQKLTMAAFLHDVILTNQDLAQVQTKTALEALEGTKYSRAEIRDYVLHPSRAAAVAQQFEEVPPDVDSVIAQHHERPDGTGFPRGLIKNQIAPLSCLFIVAHELVSAIYASTGKFEMSEFLEKHKDEYVTGNFKKIFGVLKELKL